MVQSPDLEQMAGEAIQYGAVASVDHANATCTVQLGELETGNLPWVAQRAGGARLWSPPSVGEQCIVLCPEGDLDNALVIVGLWSDAFPPPSNSPDVIHLEMPDGAVISYDHAAHALAVTLPEGGTATIAAPGGLTIEADTIINGDVAIDGNLTVTGKVTASDDVVGGGVSLKGHKHGGVQAGGAQTGGPA